jgi:hypothetical protein
VIEEINPKTEAAGYAVGSENKTDGSRQIKISDKNQSLEKSNIA